MLNAYLLHLQITKCYEIYELMPSSYLLTCRPCYALFHFYLQPYSGRFSLCWKNKYLPSLQQLSMALRYGTNGSGRQLSERHCFTNIYIASLIDHKFGFSYPWQILNKPFKFPSMYLAGIGIDVILIVFSQRSLLTCTDCLTRLMVVSIPKLIR